MTIFYLHGNVGAPPCMPTNRTECICLKHYWNAVHRKGCALQDGFFTLKGLIKRPKRSANEVRHLKKNSHCLSRLSDLLFERAAPGFDAQISKLPEPAEPCAKHIKRVRLPKTQLHCFSWRWRELLFRKISKVSVICYELKVVPRTGS